MDPETSAPQNQPEPTPPEVPQPAVPPIPPTPPVGPVPPVPVAAPAAGATPPISASQTTEEVVPGTPDTWQGAFGAYKYAKAATKVNLGTLIIFWLFSLLLGSVVGLKYKAAGDLLSLVVGSLATAGYTLAYIAGVRRQKLSFGTALKAAVPLWPKMIVLNVLVDVSLGVSFLLLIIPFFFVWPRLTLAQYFLVDQKLSILGAYKTSWHATKGHASKAWGIIGATFAMALLIVTIVGIPFAIYFLVMYSAAFAVLYEYLLKAEPVPAEAAVAATPASVSPPAVTVSPEPPAPLMGS